MAFDLSKLGNITEERLIELAMESLRKEDTQARKSQKLPKKRSPQEAYRLRVQFDNAYDAFRLKVGEHYSITASTPSAKRRLDLVGMHVDNRYSYLVIAVALPHAMTVSLEERTRQSARPDDIAKFCHLLAAGGNDDAVVRQLAIAAWFATSIVRTACSHFGVHATVLLGDVMDDGNGRVDPRAVFEAANEARGDHHSFYAILFEIWHTSHGLCVPSPF